MSDYNTKNNRAVWFDIPVSDLGRSVEFYAAVLAVGVTEEEFGEMKFGLLEHKDGNGGCLVVQPEGVSKTGLLVYFNVDGRIRDAVAKVGEKGEEIIEDVHSLGPHGFRALVLDSEGNRIALHSESDA